MEITKNEVALPDVVEPEIYRQLWHDLSALTDDALRAHYATFGEAEGRRANRLASRKDFVALIPSDGPALEIGPFHNPLLTGPFVQYFDVLTTPDLIARAKGLGVQNPNVPEIDFVSRTGDLSIISKSFDYIISSHCIEHQPDLVSHLRQVERLLSPNGAYFVLVPDKRYCFDAYLAESTVADVLDAHLSQRKVHLLKSVIEHRALTTHNDSALHWAGDHGARSANQAVRVATGVRQYEAAAGGYLDVHAWYFTPESISRLLTTLQQLDYTSLNLERLYPTRRPFNEFWMVLRKSK